MSTSRFRLIGSRATVFTLAAAAACAVSASTRIAGTAAAAAQAHVAAPAAVHRERIVDVVAFGARIRIAVTKLPVPPLPLFAGAWTRERAAVVVTERKGTETITTWIAPAYQAARPRGTPALASVRVKMRAGGDSEDDDFTFTPRPLDRGTRGTSVVPHVAVPIGNDLAVLLRIVVLRGDTKLALDDEARPSRDIVCSRTTSGRACL
ncbi:MAG TPA: hypothetical protein VFB22_01365 [Candidatus Baltobacteraceae bacterium]|nr:hypothetical protein [Candidatus Baltobacteraceae bacterium]